VIFQEQVTPAVKVLQDPLLGVDGVSGGIPAANVPG